MSIEAKYDFDNEKYIISPAKLRSYAGLSDKSDEEIEEIRIMLLELSEVLYMSYSNE